MAKKLGDVALSISSVTSIADDRFNSIEEKLNRSNTQLPTISPAPIPNPLKERRISSLSMPVYVWDALADAAHNAREPQNIFVMKALKMAGLSIEEEDLIDPRKTRYSK